MVKNMTNKYSIANEEELKKKLKIKKWNQLSKDKFINFIELIPNTDPEIVKQAIAQFPEFAKMSKDMFAELGEAFSKAVESGDKSYAQFVEQCNSIINVLEKKLDNDNLSFEQEQYYINELHKMMEILSEKESEHKNYLFKILGIAAGTLAGIGAVAALILGSNIKIPFKKSNNS